VVLDWQRMLLAVVTLAVLVLLLRWAYGNERGRRTSLVERRPKTGHSNEYGLLVAIAAPGNYIEGELARQRLEAAGIRSNLVTTVDGPRVMVFADDEVRARRLLAS
jgi:hypothetical protein